MSDQAERVIPLRIVPDGEPPPASAPEAETFTANDIHYEVSIDDEPVPGPSVQVDPAPEAARDVLILPVIPEHLQSIEGIKKAVALHAHRQWHRARYHGIRSPRYLLVMCLWALIGLAKLGGRQVRWWWHLEAHTLRSQAVAAGDSREYMKLHKEGKEVRRVRGIVLLGELAAVALATFLLFRYAPWFTLLVPVVLLPWLAHYGRPADKPILHAAVVTPRFRKLSADIVLRAYYAAGLGHAEKPDQQITFGSTMNRDGEGTRVKVDLPYGKSLKDAMGVKDAIASGLDVTESQVFLHRDPTSARRHTLWVADRDPLAVPVGRTPLLACKQTDIWKPAPIGLDERGSLVRVPLMWQSCLCGALPRMGKTFCVRCLALYCALDPYVRMHVFDPTGKPDWRKFSLVAENYAFGLTPTRDGLPAEIFLGALEHLKNVVNDRYERLSQLQEKAPALVPEGKLTRELARNLRYNMQVDVLVIDEFQEYLDLGKISDQIAELLVFITKVGPAAGMPVILATQRPSGIGTGQVATRFTALRDMCQVRIGLRCPDWRVSEMVLGAGALGEGLDASKLLPEYKGVAVLRGASDKSPTVRTYLADGQDAEKILVAARAMRERAGTLAGMALGETGPETVSILADVLAVLAGETAMQWETLAPLLAQRFPDRHGDCTAESVSAQCRASGVPSVDVKRSGRSLMGCRRDDIEAAIRGRQP